jgi:Protein of unknown function (DUF3551)
LTPSSAPPQFALKKFSGAQRGDAAMRSAIVLAGAIFLISISVAQAEEWCGYAAGQKSLIECGYSSISECQSALGKGGMCFVDPEVALNGKSHPPARPDSVRPMPAALVIEK